jgi:hypothetical protein
MARGGRRQPRDARGRFSSTGATARGGRLSTASGKRRATVTAKAKGQAPAGTVGGRRRKPSAPANGIRPTGTLKRPVPVSSIKPTNRRTDRKPPLGLKANAVRTFNPKTPGLALGQMERRVDRRIDKFDQEMKKASKAFKEVKPKVDKAMRQLERSNADDIVKRLSTNKADRLVSGVVMGEIGGRMGAKAIQRRMGRAADAAARGSKPAAKAREIYGNQLAFMGTGKPKAAKNNLRPGPRNTQGPPKRTRKPRRKK